MIPKTVPVDCGPETTELLEALLAGHPNYPCVMRARFMVEGRLVHVAIRSFAHITPEEEPSLPAEEAWLRITGTVEKPTGEKPVEIDYSVSLRVGSITYMVDR